MNIDSLHYLDIVRTMVLPLPQVEEYTCFGTPAFRVKKKLLARLKEDGETLVVRNKEREKWMQINPTVFFITAHYLNYPSLLVDLTKVEKKDLQQLLQNAWQEIVPNKLKKMLE